MGTKGQQAGGEQDTRQQPYRHRGTGLSGSFALLHRGGNLRDGSQGRIIYLIHISCSIAGSIAGELALVQGSDKLLDGGVRDVVRRQLLTDIVARQLFDGHRQPVAHIAPEGTQHLVVELALFAVVHQAGGFLQSLRGHLAGFSGTLLHHVGILDGATAEDDEQGHEAAQQDAEGDPVFSRAEIEVADAALAGVAGLDVAYVAVQLTHVFLRGIGRRRCCRTVALGYVKREGLGLDGLVGIGLQVEVGIGNGGYLEGALMARHGEEVIDDRPLQPLGGEPRLVGHLGIVAVEVLGKLDNGLLQQFHITHATHRDAQLHRVVGFHLALLQLG